MTTGPLGPALVAEALGTFALVFVGCGAIAVGDLGTAGVAAAFGLAITTMVFALGHVSGAHFNPAVTAGFAAGRHFPLRRVGPYWAAQVGGAVLAAALLRTHPRRPRVHRCDVAGGQASGRRSSGRRS